MDHISARKKGIAVWENVRVKTTAVPEEIMNQVKKICQYVLTVPVSAINMKLNMAKTGSQHILTDYTFSAPGHGRIYHLHTFQNFGHILLRNIRQRFPDAAQIYAFPQLHHFLNHRV